MQFFRVYVELAPPGGGLPAAAGVASAGAEGRGRSRRGAALARVFAIAFPQRRQRAAARGTEQVLTHARRARG